MDNIHIYIYIYRERESEREHRRCDAGPSRRGAASRRTAEPEAPDSLFVSLPQAQALGRVFTTPVRRAIEFGLQSSACGLRARMIAQASKPTGRVWSLLSLFARRSPTQNAGIHA